MALNDPTALQTATRQPLLRVLNNGQPMPGALSAEVTQNKRLAWSDYPEGLIF
jgi:hypothetical protein